MTSTFNGIEVVAVVVGNRSVSTCCGECQFRPLSGYEEPCNSCRPTLNDYIWMTPLNAIAFRLAGETT